mgnify:CR=1 FL=1|jgi:DNA-binding PadR family transcriptional regulator
MPINRLRNKITKEVMWLYILKLLKVKPRYAYELKKEIQKTFGFNSATITSYVILYKLELEGYVSSKMDKTNKGGPKRKYYHITKKGEKLFSNGKFLLQETVKKLFR